MLKIINIVKEYKVEEDSVLALNDVSIEFRKNEFVSILGPSGCGKTTLLNIIGGLDRYTSGDIQIDGISTKEYDDVDWDVYRNRRIGFVFQSYNLIPHMNILKNVAMSLTLAGVEREERRRRALEALEKVGLASQARKKPNQLSGGQMQRVAIARALVNNPEIILADEPTGALDSESGIQVMDLLKEVAKDRLVIMVTHNPSLAQEYSTRIVYLKDGQVVGDTQPFNSQEENEDGTPFEVVDDACVNDNSADTVANQSQDGEVVEAENDFVLNADEKAETRNSNVKPNKCKQNHEKLKAKWRKIRNADKAGMKLTTAISLSWNNLLAKKGRTLLTSIAGSIGIIGIILVLSLSTGATKYIRSLEENALSTYPLTVSQTNTDMSAILSLLMEDDETRPTNPSTDEIYTSKMLGKVIGNLASLMTKNDLKSFKSYIDANFDTSLATIKYNYGVNFNAFIDDPKHDDLYMKVNPYQDTMGAVLDSLPDSIKNMEIGGKTLNEMLGQFTSMDSSMMNSWGEMSSNQALLESQYELVGENSRWPSSATEAVVVVDSKNQLMDYQLFMLGLMSSDDILSAIAGGSFADFTTDVDELLSLKYHVISDADYLTDNGNGTWTAEPKTNLNKNFVNSRNPIEVSVVGVVRPKEGATVASINGVLGYTHALSEMLIERANNHAAIRAMEDAKTYAEEELADNKYVSVINYSYVSNNGTLVTITAGETEIPFSESGTNAHVELLRKLGAANLEDPTSINFYCASFEAKEKIIDFINGYNKYSKQQDPDFVDLRYGDNLAVMMSFVNTMANTITGVLVAFAAISLIVSTIMIAIIIYTSVLERRKEIGVLRSIGARKKDIARVFIAESAILGGYSGIIGIIVSFILSLIGSKILEVVFAITGLMSVTWWHCLMMFVISMVLSMLAGFIPSRIAAKKDPAIALRSE